jgi:hypothetical protein
MMIVMTHQQQQQHPTGKLGAAGAGGFAAAPNTSIGAGTLVANNVDQLFKQN